MRIKTLLTLLAVGAGATLFAATVPFASGATSKKVHASSVTVRISTKSVPGLGHVLVDSKGKTLYMFEPDKDKKVTCFKTCAKIWPPVFLPAGGKAVATGGAMQSLLGSDKDSAGGRVVTYKGWPLYGYLGDTKTGQAYGQALNVNGGLWYVLSPAGAVIKHKPTKGGGSGGGGGGGGGSTTTTTTTTTTSTSTTTGPSQCTDEDNDGDENGGGPDDGDGCL